MSEKKAPKDAIKAMESMMTPESVAKSDEIFRKKMAKLNMLGPQILTRSGGLQKKSFNTEGYSVVLTCEAFPEQYDVLRKGKPTGYIRLRHGGLNVWCPDPSFSSTCVYHAEVGYGEFDNDEQRALHMEIALREIDRWYRKNIGAKK